MNAVLSLAGVGVLSWGLRVLFITVVPARRLPRGFRRALEHVGPVVLAALVATHLARGAGPLAVFAPSSSLVALLAAAIVAWRTRNLPATVAVALATAWVLSAVF